MEDSVIKTHVWHGGDCFFVSTINRRSSIGDASRYNETMVWTYDWERRDRGNLIGQFDDRTGSIRKHQSVVESLFNHGVCEKESK